MRLYNCRFFQKRFTSVLILNLLALYTMAQVTVSGKVTDKEGQALPGISVLVRNSNFGASTNSEGVYSFTADLKPGTYVLDISGIGFKRLEQPLTVGSASSYSVNSQLDADPLGLDEVVVTGTSAGTTRRQLGSYISTVKGDQLLKGAAGNVLSALQGKTAGAQIIQNSGDPAGGVSVRLRGISSILSSSEPLYIVDGVIINNATNRVTNTQSKIVRMEFCI